MRRVRRRFRLALILGAGVMAAVVGVIAYAGHVFSSLELSSVDTRFSIRGDQPAHNLAVVAIDDNTISQLGRWPFARHYHAQAIDRLRAAGARVIAYDVQFTEPTQASEDNALIDSVANTHHVVLATTDVAAGGKSPVFGGGDILNQIGARSGQSQFPTDSDAVIRRMPYSVDNLESFAIVAAEDWLGHPINPSAVPANGAWIDYRGGPGHIQTVSFSDLLAGRFSPNAFRGKVVVVGTTSPSLQDVHATSTSGGGLMAGPEIQANAISTAIRGFPLSSASGVVNILLIIALGFAVPLTMLRFRSPLAALVGPVIGGIYFGVTLLAFDSGLILSLVYPLTALIVGTVTALAASLVLGAFERQRVHDLFARFVPEAVVDDVVARTDEDLRLGGERRVVSILFSDIRGFTTFSETRTPDEVIRVLNRYLTIMSDAVLAEGGTLVSYMGDGIMALFGAPIEQPDHADRALRTARAMTGPCLERINAWLEDQDLGVQFRIGVGINSGPAMAGNVGSERRLEYTAIGDVCNTASRLEGMTKGTPHMIFISDSTRSMLTEETADLIHVDEMPVRGRQEPIGVWSVKEPAEQLTAEQVTG